MKPTARPPRLKESEEFGAALRLLDGEALPPAQLARVEQRIAALVAPAATGAAGTGAGAAASGAAASGAAGAGAGAALLKIGVPVLIAALGAGSYLVATRPASAPASVASTAIVAATRNPLPPTPAPAAASDARVLEPDTSLAREDAAPQAHATAPGRGPSRRLPGRTPDAPEERAPIADAAVAPAPVDPPRAPAAIEPAPSQLPEQIRLFAAAREAARKGDLARALSLIQQLLERFPKTALGAEARLSQAEYLLRAGQLPKATSAVRALLVDPQHLGRRGELRRVLGDLLRKQGDCPGALEAYRQALAGGLSEAEARAARAGIAACSPQKKD